VEGAAFVLAPTLNLFLLVFAILQLLVIIGLADPLIFVAKSAGDKAVKPMLVLIANVTCGWEATRPCFYPASESIDVRVLRPFECSDCMRGSGGGAAYRSHKHPSRHTGRLPIERSVIKEEEKRVMWYPV
jgi:hypothetical protein